MNGARHNILLYDYFKLLLPTYRENESIILLWQILAKEFHELQVVFDQLKDGMSIAKASGYTLDLFGYELGLARNGLSDVDYRKALLVITYTLGNKVTIPNLRALLNNITQGKSGIIIKEGNAKVYITLSCTKEQEDLIRSLLPSFFGAGIGYDLDIKGFIEQDNKVYYITQDDDISKLEQHSVEKGPNE